MRLSINSKDIIRISINIYLFFKVRENISISILLSDILAKNLFPAAGRGRKSLLLHPEII